MERVWRRDELRRSDPEMMDVIITSSFPELGKLAAFRFLEYVQMKPNAVVSLPTGKTPEYFIKWVQHILAEWDSDEISQRRREIGMPPYKPSLQNLRFVQMDEFFPIDPKQRNSFNAFVRSYYVKGFGLDEENCLLIDTSDIVTVGLFDECIDLDLVNRPCVTLSVKDQERRAVILRVNDYCRAYEAKIRAWGGIDFFLGGIGPDGHIAFNIRGSDFDSPTRLIRLNYESMAASAESLGGMSVARKKLVITIGLGTISFNPECRAVIFAAGEAKAEIVKAAIESPTSNEYPSHALRRLHNSAFFITGGAAKMLGRVKSIPVSSSRDIRKMVAEKLARGCGHALKKFLHTEPHHDDIMLGYLPFILTQRVAGSGSDIFSCGTSGFNSVSNTFLVDALMNATAVIAPQLTLDLSRSGFESDVDLFLRGVEDKQDTLMRAALSRRLTRCTGGDMSELNRILDHVQRMHEGEAPDDEIRRLKGCCREFEAECLWRGLGWSTSTVRHLRLGFYTSDIFNPQPTHERDAKPILELLKAENPDIVTLALDPESSGPDTHYKVLQATTAALIEYAQVRPDVKVWGYRNVWYTFKFEDADIIVPVTKKNMQTTKRLFLSCYQTQRDAEFPSHKLDGPFTSIVCSIWEQQLSEVRRLLGHGDDLLAPDLVGLVYLKELTVSELTSYSRSLAGV